MYNLLAVAPWLTTVFSVIVAILILLATITVHEFGHYIVGKLLKFKINELAIGMGPAIYKKVKKDGEVFSIRLFPLGGFCAFEGEDEDDKAVEKKTQKTQEVYGKDYPDKQSAEQKEPPKKKQLSENAFNNKKPWQRILVLVAGATFNFVVAVIIVMISYVGYGHMAYSTGEILAPQTQTEEALSLEKGDILVEVEGKFLYYVTDLVTALDGKEKGDIVTVTVMRDGKRIEREVTLRKSVDSKHMADVDDCFTALGVASVLYVQGAEGTALEKGTYIYRFKEDGKEYSDCTRVYTVDDLYQKLKLLNPNETLTVYIPDPNSAAGEKLEYTFTAPQGFNTVDLNNKDAVLSAFGIKSTELYYQIGSQSVKFGFFENIGRGLVYSLKTIPVTLKSFWQLITGSLPISNVSGPIGTITMTSQMVSLGFEYVLNIASLIGLSVAIFNLLPFPALDGARAVFVIIEWIRKKPVNRNVEGIIHFVGLIVLVVFALLIDALKLFV